MYYTYGQRQGLGIGGKKQFGESPWYVVGKDMDKNILQVAQGNQNKYLLSSSLKASIPTWINSSGPVMPLRCTAKIRYRQEDQLCTVSQYDTNHLRVDFDQPQRAITPGQYIVLYDEERCLGGAIIELFFS
jgi:tRNA-specific 2-thiouridylase